MCDIVQINYYDALYDHISCYNVEPKLRSLLSPIKKLNIFAINLEFWECLAALLMAIFYMKQNFRLYYPSVIILSNCESERCIWSISLWVNLCPVNHQTKILGSQRSISHALLPSRLNDNLWPSYWINQWFSLLMPYKYFELQCARFCTCR